MVAAFDYVPLVELRYIALWRLLIRIVLMVTSLTKT
jgi:hypothetical protein